MRPKLRKLSLAALVILTAAFAFLILTANKSAPLPPLPNPNGYDDLVKAGQMLDGDLPGWQELRDMSEEELRTAFASTALSKHGEALALAREGLDRACRVPLNYSPTSAAPLEGLSANKRVAIAFTALARLAEMENRPSDAARSYLEAIRLSHESTRGGVVIDSMVDSAIEAIGLGCLEKLGPKLNAQQCREVAAALETIDAKRESAEVVLQQERAWARRTYGLKGQIARLISFKSIRRSEQKQAARINKQQTQMRLLLVNLAARAFELETGARPKTFADLVPAYLKTAPQALLIGTNIFSPP